jgi:hypothetical protein
VKRISSRWTFFNKRIFPVIWFGIICLVFSGFAVDMLVKRQVNLVVILVPAFMIVFGYILFKKLIFDLVDEAWDAGDYLIFKNKGIEEIVRLENIMNVSASTFTNPPRVTLTLRAPSRLGSEITFSPPTPFTLNPFKKSPIVDELIQRVDRARSR